MRRTAVVISAAYAALLASVRLIEEATSSDSAIVSDLYHAADEMYRKAQHESAPARLIALLSAADALLDAAVYHTTSVHGSADRIARYDVRRRQRRLKRLLHAAEAPAASE